MHLKSKCYVWVNSLYLGEKQYGIQATHVVTDMTVQYPDNKLFRQWIEHDKILIILAGINSGTLRRVRDILRFAAEAYAEELPEGVEIPVVAFHEDEESLDGALTAVGFVFPDELRDATAVFDVLKTEELHQFFMGEDFEKDKFNAWFNNQRLA